MPLSPRRIVPPLLLCLLLGFVGLSGCSSFYNESPPLPDSTFKRVLVDLHLTSARKQLASNVPPGIRDSLFSYHGIERKDFDATLHYYSQHPKAFESLYDAVIDTLNALQTASPRRPSLKDSVAGPPQIDRRP